MLTVLCNEKYSMDVTDRPILCCPMLMALVMHMTLWVWDSNQLENVIVDISEIGYCTCRPDKNVVQVQYLPHDVTSWSPITTENVRVKAGDIVDST